MAIEQPQPVVMQLPKDLVEAQIKTLVMDACLRNGGEIVRAMVDHVLLEKSDYGRRTVLDKAITELVLAACQAAAKEWVSEQAPVIREAVRKRLTAEKTKLIASLCDKLTDRMVTGIHVSVQMIEDR